MERYAFFRQLGKAVYGIDAAYDVFSKSAQIKPNMLWLLSALNDGEGHTQKQICWDWGFPKTTVNTLIKELEKGGFGGAEPHSRRAQGAFRNADRSGQRLCE